MGTSSDETLKLWASILVLLIFGATCLWPGCRTDPEETIRVLEAQGYTDVTPGGWAYFRCGEDDWSATHFTATTPAGARASGVVCCGLFVKACTVRW